MAPLPRRAAAGTALLTGIALFAAVLPPGVAGAAPGAAPGAASATPRAGALPAYLSPAEQSALLKDATADREATAARLGLGGKERLVPRSVVKDTDGTLHTRYERTYDGLPVLGGDLVVHTAPAGTLKGVDKATRSRISVPSTTPARKAGSAQAFSVGAAKAAGTEDAKLGRAARKVVWAAGERPVLAWETVVKGTQADGTPSELHVVTDATTGAELNRREAVRNALGTGEPGGAPAADRKTARDKGRDTGNTARGERAEARGVGHSRYSGQVDLGTSRFGTFYNMTDSARGGHRTYDLLNGGTYYGEGGRLLTDTDNVWGDGTSASRQTDAVDAAYGAQVTWDYLTDVHKRYGVRNDGDGASSKVHYYNDYRGAYWRDGCFCVLYGDGGTTPYTSIDMAAHEFTAGIIASTTNFGYYGESNGIGEATKDIFATGVEFHAANPNDPGDYVIGENVDHGGLNARPRYMDRPSKNIRGTDYWHPRISSSSHGTYMAGPASHWFYLVSEGDGPKTINGVSYDSPTHDGLPVTPIGRAAAEQIWYRALTVYMTSTTDYLGARAATLAATADLYGASSPTHQKVEEAWGAVNVGVRPGGSPRPVGPSFENTGNYPIPDDTSPADSPITVTGVPGNAPSVLVVDTNIADAGQRMELVAPDGSTYPLVSGFALENGPSIATTGVDASAETANGTWKLRVRGSGYNVGRYIDSWKLTF